MWRCFPTIMPIISQHHLALKASSVRLPKRAMTCCGETLCVHRKCLKMRSARGLHHSQFVNGHRTAGGGTSEFVSGRESSRCAGALHNSERGFTYL